MPSEVSIVSGGESFDQLKRELAEGREQQAATAEILKVISSSPTDLPRVMATVAYNAAHVCGASDAQVYRVDDGALRIVASHGEVGATASARARGLPLTRGTVTGRAFLDRQSIHVLDVAAVLETEFSGCGLLPKGTWVPYCPCNPAVEQEHFYRRDHDSPNGRGPIL